MGSSGSTNSATARLLRREQREVPGISRMFGYRRRSYFTEPASSPCT